MPHLRAHFLASYLMSSANIQLVEDVLRSWSNVCRIVRLMGIWHMCYVPSPTKNANASFLQMMLIRYKDSWK